MFSWALKRFKTSLAHLKMWTRLEFFATDEKTRVHELFTEVNDADEAVEALCFFVGLVW